MADFSVYIVRCADGTLYTGIATDVKRRVGEHNHGEKGAKYTRTRRPVKLVYEEVCGTRADASREEYRIKKMPRTKKQEMISIYQKYNTA